MPLSPSLQSEIEKEGWRIAPNAEPFAAGGSADVYECFHIPHVGRVLKLMHLGGVGTPRPELDGAAIRFLQAMRGHKRSSSVAVLKHHARHGNRLGREIEFLQSIDHPNVIKVLAAPKKPTPDWFIMPLMAHGTLEARAEQYHGKFREACSTLEPIASAVAAVHAAGYVHRDIKPANIFYEPSGSVLADLGIAFDPEADRLTKTAHEVWSRDWAPDWVIGRKAETYSPRLDVFMLAKTLYFLITGKKPRASQIADEDFAVDRLYPEMPHSTFLQDFLLRYLVSKESDCGARDAAEFAEHLDHVVRVLVGRRERTTLLSYLTARASGGFANSDDNKFSSVPAFVPAGTTQFYAKLRAVRPSGNDVANSFVELVARSENGVELAKTRLELSSQDGDAWLPEAKLDLPRPIERDSWCLFDLFLSDGVRCSGLILQAR